MIEVKIRTMTEEELQQCVKNAVVGALKELGIQNVSVRGTTAHEDEDELIGTKEACRILGCCPKTMQSYRNRELFQVIMRGPRKALYYKSAILAFRDANTRSSRNDK